MLSSKIIMVTFIMLFSLSAVSAELTVDDKALKAAKALYSMNIGSTQAAKFRIGSKACIGIDDTIQNCTIEILVSEENPTPSGISYLAKTANNQLIAIEQICKYCW